MNTNRFNIGVTTSQVDEILKRLMSMMRTFPRPESEEDYRKLVSEWERALNFSGTKYPPAIYAEAVTSFLSEATVKTFPPLPGDILLHCKKVMERIHSDPARRAKIEKWQQQRREHRVALLTGGDQ